MNKLLDDVRALTRAFVARFEALPRDGAAEIWARAAGLDQAFGALTGAAMPLTSRALPGTRRVAVGLGDGDGRVWLVLERLGKDGYRVQASATSAARAAALMGLPPIALEEATASRPRVGLEPREPGHGLVARRAAHVGRRTQPDAEARPLGAAEEEAAEVVAELDAAHAGRLAVGHAGDR